MSIVEHRFNHVLSNIKSTGAVVAGNWDKYRGEVAINKEYVIKYGGTSVKSTGKSSMQVDAHQCREQRPAATELRALSVNNAQNLKGSA